MRRLLDWVADRLIDFAVHAECAVSGHEPGGAGVTCACCGAKLDERTRLR